VNFAPKDERSRVARLCKADDLQPHKAGTRCGITEFQPTRKERAAEPKGARIHSFTTPCSGAIFS
jgi:hypothetical protein